MARSTLPLTDTQIKNAKPKDKEYKLFDGGGMYLLVSSNGSKGWRIKYRFEGKEQRLSFGSYPIVSLADARAKRDELKKQVASGVNPSNMRKDIKEQYKIQKVKDENTFENIANEYTALRENKLVHGTYKRMIQRLNNYVYPAIGKHNIDEITIQDILSIIRDIEVDAKNETAHRVLNLISQVYKYALSVGKAKHNVANDIDSRYALAPIITKHFPTIIDDSEIAKLLHGIDQYSGQFAVKTALQLLPYVALRPSNIRFAEWNDLNFDKREWRISAEKMKMRSAHIVPLTDRMIEIFESIRPYTGNGSYVFSTFYRGEQTPMSENTLNNALKSVLSNSKIQGEIVSHGFRGMFSTIAHENMSSHGLNSEIIERQLAHKEDNKTKGAYNHAEYMHDRRLLVQWWNDYLDALKAKVNP